MEPNVRVPLWKLRNLEEAAASLVDLRARMDGALERLDRAVSPRDVQLARKGVSDTHRDLRRLARRLQESVRILSRTPVETLFSGLRRRVRELSREQGKQVDLVLKGGETEADRPVLDAMRDPLVHLVLNSVTHGIEPVEERVRNGKPEQAILEVWARVVGDSLLLSVEDDGRGFDRDAIVRRAIEKGLVSGDDVAELTNDEVYDFVFTPSFSTSSEVSHVAGRGVGLDIVLTAVHRQGGFVDVASWPGRGSRITLRLPQAAAVIQALLVRVGSVQVAIPSTSVASVRSFVPPATGSPRQNKQRSRIAGRIDLGAALGLSQSTPARIVEIGLAQRRVELLVDECLRQEQIAVKNLGPIVGEVPGLMGATILSDSRVTLVLDVQGLFHLSEHAS